MPPSIANSGGAMIAVDTNVVIRFLTGDDPEQAQRARMLVAQQEVWVSLTVLLETEWVLRRLYRLKPALVAAALRRFAGLRTVTVENEQVLASALEWCERGIDFADALHLAAAEGCDGFVTFDAPLVKAAHRIGVAGVAQPRP